jgi:hypothetical protein
MDVDPVDCTDGGLAAKPVQGWANKSGTAASIIDKLPPRRHWRAVCFSALGQSGKLTFDGVSSRLLLTGHTRIECGSNGVHTAS